MISPKVCFALLLGSLLSGGVRATDVTVSGFNFYNGAEWPGATGSLDITHVPNGDSIQALNYNVSSGYVYSVLKLTSPVTAGYVRFRVDAPAAVPLGLRVVDATGQTLEYSINRGTSAIDELGWSELTVNLASPAAHFGGANDGKVHGAINEVSLVVNSYPKFGTAYFRSVELLENTPSTSYPVLPQNIASVAQFSFGSAQAAAGSLQVYNPANGASLEALSYNFTGGGHYVASVARLSPSVNGSYVHLRFRAPSGVGVAFQVIDQSGQTLNYLISRSSLTQDNMGWYTLTQNVESAPSGQHWGGANNGRLQGNIVEVRLVANKLSAGSTTGTVYFNDIQILDHAPSQYYAAVTPSVTPFKSIAFDDDSAQYPGATGSLIQTPMSGGDVEQTMNYDFTGGGHYVASTMDLATPTAGNTIRFLAQAPAGVNLLLLVIDSTGQHLQYLVTKPLATLAETGWVQHVVRLGQTSSHYSGANDGVVHGPINTVMLLVNFTSASVANVFNITDIQRTGVVRLRQFLVDNEWSQLDLTPGTAALAGLRPKGSNPASVMALSLDTIVPGDLELAKSIGFNRIRFNMGWEAIEKSAGLYGFTTYDRYVQEATSAGLSSQLILTGNNLLYASATNVFLTATKDFDAYVNFAAAAASHFKDDNVVYELWNEADLAKQVTPASFASMVTQSSAAMLAVNGGAAIVSGGLAYEDFPYVQDLVSTAALKDTKGMGVHPYARTQENLQTWDSPENAADSEMAASDLIGSNQPLWASELGSSASWYSNTDGTVSYNLLRQALVLARDVLSQWAANVHEACIYKLRDMATGYSATNAFDNFGLIDINNNNKPAMVALRMLFDSANGRTYQGMLTGNPTSLQAMKFSGSGKETVYVAWTDNKDNSTASVTALNACNAYLDIAGNATNVATPCATDMQGNALACTAAANDRVTCPISEAAGPIFIRQTVE
jgi:hypothetical protein